MQLIDSHAHLTMPEVLPHLEKIVERAQLNHIVHVINVCTDAASLQEGIALHQRHPWILNAGATSPHDVDPEGEKYFHAFANAARSHQLVAIGETGLDYYYEHSLPAVQKQFLIRYLHLAIECRLPVIFHCREAFSDLFEMTDQEYAKNSAAVVHCFTGTLDEAKKAVSRGWMISVSGIATFKKSQELRDVVRWLPMENMLIETDTPFLAPQSKRGQMNEPSWIQETAECVAQTKGIPLEVVAQITTQNAQKFFRIQG